jgi:hypothetical protein
MKEFFMPAHLISSIHHLASRLLPLALGLAMLLPLSNPLAASTDTREFIGFWEFPEPAGDKAIVIIKAGGRLSCFWSGSFSRAIEQGRWQMEDDKLVATWDSGHVDQFRKLGDNAMERRALGKDPSPQADPVSTVRGVRVDSRLPGSLAVDRSPEERTSRSETQPPTEARPLRNAFIGFWKIPQDTGFMGLGNSEEFFYLRISRNGQASVALRNWDGDNAFRGKWQLQGDRLHIEWPDEHKDILRSAANGHELASFRPRDAFPDRPNITRPAQMVPPIEGQRYFAAGEFKRLSVSDIRGTWQAVESSERKETITIHGWGNATRAAVGNAVDSGKWRLQTDRVIISWEDGTTDVLRVDFPRIIQESFGPGEPTSGLPRRSFEVAKTAP